MQGVRRRRGAELASAIVGAAWEILIEGGYEQLTMDSVAVWARTSKPVLYRRWHSRAELLLTALIDRILPPKFPDEDHGDLRVDLIALRGSLADRFAGFPRRWPIDFTRQW
ncbi:TetR/AcrR family transcriptional regulator [Streptomyces sp. NPDC091972]|uniref:TetR/AcrR family transcriptional regulator n=1 Tax=Streptomyces sp. NPDC091972 TaxID=3366007 RepID=UPI003827ED37